MPTPPTNELDLRVIEDRRVVEDRVIDDRDPVPEPDARSRLLDLALASGYVVDWQIEARSDLAETASG